MITKVIHHTNKIYDTLQNKAYVKTMENILTNQI